MLWSEEWRALRRWTARLPWWQQWLILPPATPVVLLIAAACLCPRTLALSAATLIAAYVALARTGHFDIAWGEIRKKLIYYYIYFITFIYFLCLRDGLGLLFERWRSSSRPGSDPDEARA